MSPAPKHTPGPWRVTTDGGLEIATLHGCTNRPTEDGLGQRWVYIKTCTGWGGAETPEEQDANAILMAAAPDLLAEIKEARITLSLLRTQIATEIGKGVTQWDGVPELVQKQIGSIDAAITKATGA